MSTDNEALPPLRGDGFWEERMKTIQAECGAPDTTGVWHALWRVRDELERWAIGYARAALAQRQQVPEGWRDALMAASIALRQLSERAKQVKAALDADLPDGSPVHPQSSALTWPISTALLAIDKIEAALTAAPPAQQGDEFERGRQLGMQQERALWELAASTQEIESAQQTCRKCGGQMSPGKAIAQTFDCSDEGTMSPGGPGKLVDCLKCEACGASTT